MILVSPFWPCRICDDLSNHIRACAANLQPQNILFYDMGVTQSNCRHPTPYLAGLKFHKLMDLITILQSDLKMFNSYQIAYVTYVYNLMNLKIEFMLYLLI